MEKTPSRYLVLAGTFFTSLSSIFIRFSEAPSIVISAYRMLLYTLVGGMLIISGISYYLTAQKLINNEI